MRFWPRRNELTIATGELAKGAAELDDEIARFERSVEKASTRARVIRRRPRCRPPALKPRRPRVRRPAPKGIPAGLSTIDCVKPLNLLGLSLQALPQAILRRLGRLR